MRRSSRKHLVPAPPSVLLLAGILVGSLFACARPATLSQAEPETAPRAAPVTTSDLTSIEGQQEFLEGGETLMRARATRVVTAADLTSREIQKQFHEPIQSLLQGRTSGVLAEVHADGSLSVRIDGAASFLTSTEPLYIVDGSPFMPGPGGRLRGINPHDIQSIEVLKYPPETSRYGVLGSNGVIVIKTIRPMP